MVLNRKTTRTFHRRLYATELVKITLLKRGDDQRMGTVRALTLYQCRRSMLFRAGQPIQRDMGADHRTVWHIPRCELERVGVEYLNPDDRIVDYDGFPSGRYWQPEASTLIIVKLFENHVCVNCLRIDPPKPGA